MFETLRTTAAACLLLLGGACLAAAPAAGEENMAALQSAYGRAVVAGEQADVYREMFASILNRVQRSYASEVDVAALAAAALKVVEPLAPGAGDPAQVFGRAINAALATLDPYSRYLDARAYGNQRGESSGRFGGLGLEVESSQGAVRVVAPIADSPAARAGMQAGDLIVRVDGEPVAGMPLAEAIARMRGQPGTQVSLAIRRSGIDNEITVALTRDTIRRQLLRWSMEGDVLVIRIGNFTGPVTAELQQAIAEATAVRAPRGFVLDLRGNPGGLLREAVTTADTFLKQGEIASLRGRTASNQRSWQADANELLEGVRLVVLIDRRSASASELVTAALQDNGRATVMGERSFGKGTVQSTYGLGEEGRGALKLTTALYYGPTGRSIQKTGVTPDVEIVASLRQHGETDQPALAKAQVEQGRCSKLIKAADPVLSCALAYLMAADMDAFLARVSR